MFIDHRIEVEVDARGRALRRPADVLIGSVVPPSVERAVMVGPE